MAAVDFDGFVPVTAVRNCQINQRRDSDSEADTIIGTNTTGTYRVARRLTTDVTRLKAIYLGWDSIGNLRDAYSVEAALEFGGSAHRLTFSGVNVGVCAPGDILISDPIDVSLSKGLDLFERGLPSVSSNTKVWPLPYYQGFSGEANALGSDHLMSTGTTSLTNTGGGYIFGAAAILGLPVSRVPVVGLISDSLMSALQDSGDALGMVGFGERALQDDFCFWNMAQANESAHQFLTTPDRFRRSDLWPCLTHAISDVAGVNDYASGRTLAQVQADALDLATQLDALGVKFWQTTTTPSDGITGAKETARVAGNTWWRAGAPIDPTTKAAVAIGTSGALTTKYVAWNGSSFDTAGTRSAGHPMAGVFEIADLAESSRDSGAWKVSITNDGTHPDGAGYQVLSAGIDTSQFTAPGVIPRLVKLGGQVVFLP